MSKHITILGAGLVGSLAAVLLRKRGFSVDLIERRPDMRKQSMSAGKSINLALSQRGWRALELAGLRKDIEEIAIPMYGRALHQTDGKEVFQPYGKNNEAIYSVSRGELNQKLMSLAEAEGTTIHFNTRITDVDIETNQLHTATALWPTQPDLLIAADGAFSALRNAYLKRDRYNYHQFYIEHGYKELHIPPTVDGKFALDKNALHIWPRKNFMLIALPNTDCSFTVTLFFPMEGPLSFQTVNTEVEIQQLFETYFPDVIPVMPDYVSMYQNNPTSSLITVKCLPWIYSDKNFLIGDAAHAIVPFFGQGMNAGFEDCRILAELIDEHGNQSWNTILPAYQQARKTNGDAVADLALYNFIEMRDLVADPAFLERKKIEKQLGTLYPEQFNSVYEMVSFSHTPYRTAWQCLEEQNHLLKQIMDAGDFATLIQTTAFKTKLDQWMTEYSHRIAAFQ
jgi:kynurenine 3-monooxygenase